MTFRKLSLAMHRFLSTLRIIYENKSDLPIERDFKAEFSLVCIASNSMAFATEHLIIFPPTIQPIFDLSTD